MKKVALCVLLALTTQVLGQEQQSLQIAASAAKRAMLTASPNMLDGTTIFTLPDFSSTIISDINTETYNWILGGNSSPLSSNDLGTLTNDDIDFVTGAGGPNTRMRITAAGNVEIVGNLTRIRNQPYSWPLASNVAGYLQNDGNGNLSWQTSVQASRAGLGSYFVNNYGTNPVAMPVSGTTILTDIVSPFGGGLSGVSILVTPPGGNAGGALVATVTVNGAPTALSVTLNGGAGFFAFTDFSATPVPFFPGNQIGVLLSDGANTFAPNVDVLVTVFANF